MIRYFSLLLIIFIPLFADEEAPSDLTEKQQISFYRGYLLWKDYLQRPGIAYDFEQIMAGMQAAESGKTYSYNEEQLSKRIRAFQEELVAKQTTENLADAEAFLAKVAQENAVEVIPQKLYYKRLKDGSGAIVKATHTPLLTYTLWTYNRWEKQETFSVDKPVPIGLAHTIPGFAQGVTGMAEGEIREIYIHPDLAYGTYGRLEPNELVIFKVEVISAHDKSL